MKKITFYLFALCCFAFSWQGVAQSVATENFATSGYDDDPTILTINSGDITVNEGQPVQAVALGEFTSHGYTTTSYCGSWYNFDLSVTGGVADGTSITGCNDNFIDLDVTGFTTITITSNDIDDWGDFINIAMDLEVTYQTPSCPLPSEMVASNITTSSADLSWTAGNTETTWNLEWKAGADFTPGNGEEDGSDTVTGTPEYNGQLTGLTDYTTYYVYYQADCGGDLSGWVSFSFVTLALPPANDDCDNAIALTVNADLDCAVVTSGTNLGATASSQTDDVEGTPNADVWFSFVATSTLHQISLSNVVAAEGTSVDMAMGVYDATGGCANLVFVDDSDPDSFSVSGLTIGNTYLVRVHGYSSAKTTFDICVGTPPPPPANDDCANAIVINESDASCNNSVAGTTASATYSEDYDCSTYYNEVWYEFTPSTSGDYNVERTLTSGSSSTYLSIYSGSCGSLTQINSYCYSTSLQETLTAGETYLISVATYNSGSVDFELCVYPEPTCFAPDTFSAAFVAPDSAELSWEAPEDGTPESYNWEVVPAGNGQGNGTIGSGNVTGLTTTVSGLTVDTLYDLYVQADCGGGDTSAWAGPFTFNAGYCLPSGTSTYTYIDTFTTTDASVGNIDNSASGLATDNYGDYFDTHTVSLATEESFDFSFEIVGGTVGAAVWVDWNNDYVFDTSEVMFTTSNYGNGPFTGTITVPAGTAEGDYRMRVLIDWNDNEPGDDDACSFGNGRGEVEDYKITVDNALSTSDFAINAFTYYPNPVKNTLTLHAENTIEQITMYNMLGQEVLRVMPNTVDSDVDMSDLSTGTYFVKVTIANVTETIRVIKQ